ncbi:MAG: AI-2E family transporter [Bacilli bacterium]|nr:AI-2E family transporter [Bacilli bacterium]
MEKNEDKINTKKLNEVISISRTLLKVLLILFVVCGTYIILILLKEVKFFSFLLTLLSVLTPFFIGVVVAWLFNPFVNMLQRKGLKRIFGVIIAYLIILAIIVLVISMIIPLIYDQISDLSETVPKIIKNAENFVDVIINKFRHIDGFDSDAIKQKLFNTISSQGEEIYTSLPNIIVGFIKNFISGIGTFFLGLLIGFFILLGFNDVSETFIMFMPQKFHKSARDLLGKINKTLRGYVNGALFDASIILVACWICFSIFGLKSALLFALFCAIMNVIPYAGPYIGAVPALLVGFSQSSSVGFAVAISIIIIQTIEGNILSPIVMSKTTNVKPVAIIIGLLIFGHFFGILGMILSTPIIGVAKVILNFFDEKYHFFSEVKHGTIKKKS